MKIFRSPIAWIGLAVALLLICISSSAFAQLDINNSIDSITAQYADNAASWGGALKGYAMELFWLLAFIDFAWMALRLILSKSDFSDWVSELLRQILFIGFFYALLQHSTEWSNAIVQSFRTAGNAASTASGGETNLGPSNILDAGIKIVSTCFHSFQFTFDKFGDSLVMVLCGILIIISFALMAALEVVVLVESYIFVYAGIIFMGFGGSNFTKDYTIRAINAVIAVGAKLFVIQLIIGLGSKMVQQWADAVSTNAPMTDSMDMLSMVGGAIVFLALTKMIPETVQGMINGASYGSGRPLMGAGMSAGQLGLAGFAGAAASMSALTGNFGQASRFSGAAAAHANDAFRHASEMDAGGMHLLRKDQNSGNSSVVDFFRPETKQPQPQSPVSPASSEPVGNTITT